MDHRDSQAEQVRPSGIEEVLSVGDLLTNRQRKRFKAGDVLLGRYRILGELGQGGMGLVFRCLDEVGGIEVAVKMLPPEVSHDSGEMEEVRENFRLVSSLAHPNIATVRTLEKDSATGEYLLVMELAQGMNLRIWRKQRPPCPISSKQSQAPKGAAGASGGRALPEILPIIRQIAVALDYAHENKVVHRDIKPSNVMVDAAGHVKVLDFGLAAQIHTSFSRISHAHYGTSGTGPYMAPEQWEGQYQDAATDQYALAVLAYELLTGHCPFESHETGVLRESVLKSAPVCPPSLSSSVRAALKRGLAKKRDARFASCEDFARALGGEKISERKAAACGHKWTRRAAGLILLAGVAAAIMWKARGCSRSDGEREASLAPGPQNGEISAIAGIASNGPAGSNPPLDAASPEAAEWEPETGGIASAEPGLEATAVPDAMPPVWVQSGSLRIQASPAGASIQVPQLGTNGYAAGEEIPNVPAGTYEAIVALAGYGARTIQVAVADGWTETNVSLAGTVEVDSTPPGAAIWFGRQKFARPTPNSILLPAGPQVLKLRLSGYVETAVAVDVRIDCTVQANAALEPVPGALRTVKIAPGSTMRFRWIPATTSPEWKTMTGRIAAELGSPLEESGREEGEAPRHVVFSNGFWMGESEVTQTQWQKTMGGNPSAYANLEATGGPVDSVRWSDATNFVERLNRSMRDRGEDPAGLSLGERFRLPDEDEWEHACRAGSFSPFHPPGEADLKRIAWYMGNSHDEVHPVGRREPNAWGLYDMHGNVMEWCRPRRGESARPALKGGSYYSFPDACRADYRYRPNNPEEKRADRGLRIVLGR